MPGVDQYEQKVLGAYGRGELRSVATKTELARFKAAARVLHKYVTGRLAEPSKPQAERPQGRVVKGRAKG